MGYAADYDARERFGDLPVELNLDARGGGIVRAVTYGAAVILKWTREEYTDGAAVPSSIDVPAKIGRGKVQHFDGR